MRKILFAFLCSLFITDLWAQNDSALLQSSAEHPFRKSVSTNDPDEAIYNGKEHLGYPSSIEGVGYYRSNDWQKGWIIYRDVYYPDVYLKYDLVKNEVIVRHFNGFTAVTLFNPRIRSFSLLNSNFIYFNQGRPSDVASGIYEVVGNGRLKLYIKRSKKITETLSTSRIDRRFVDNDVYYGFKEGLFYPIKRESHILDLVQEKKNEIKNSLKQEQLRYKDDPEKTLIRIVELYTNLTSR